MGELLMAKRRQYWPQKRQRYSIFVGVQGQHDIRAWEHGFELPEYAMNHIYPSNEYYLNQVRQSLFLIDPMIASSMPALFMRVS